MICKKCGSQLSQGDQFCMNCGTPVSYSMPTEGGQTNPQPTVGGFTPNQGGQPSSQPIHNGFSSVQPTPMSNGFDQNQGGQPSSQPIYNDFSSVQPNGINTSQTVQPTVNGYTPSQDMQPTPQSVSSGFASAQPTSQPISNGFTSVQPTPMSNGINTSQTVQPPVNGYTSNQGRQQTQYNNNSGNKHFLFILLISAVIVAVVGIVGTKIVYGIIEDKNISGSSLLTQKVAFKGFEFSIPSDWIYDMRSESLLVYRDDWAMTIEVLSGSYSTLLANKSKIAGKYTSAGFIPNNVDEKTIENLPFITVELEKSGEKGLVGFTKANASYVFGISAYNDENSIDYALLNKISPVLKSATYVDTSNNISVDKTPDFSIIKDLFE